jgi:hypothetical protein
MNPEEAKLPISESSNDLSSISDLSNKANKDETKKNGDTDSVRENDNLPKLDFPVLEKKSFDLDIPTFANKDFDIRKSQEITRSKLATFLVGILAGTIIASFTLIIVLLSISILVDDKKTSSFDKTSALAKELITVIFTAQIGLVGTALGFYFGSKSNQD